MGTTTIKGLPYPDGGDTPYVHQDVQSLAEGVDTELYVVCTSGTRPGHQAGRRIYETDTGRTLVSDGTAWQGAGAVADGTPTPLYGTYAGEPLQVVGGYGSVTTNASSVGTYAFGTIAPWSTGLMSWVPVSTTDPNYQWRVIRPATGPTTVQFVLRTHDTGAGAGAVTAGFQWIGIGW